MIYYLGCIPYLQIPLFDRYHNRVLLCTGSHAIVYTKQSRDSILNDTTTINDWDVYINLYAPVKRYIYYQAICYQLFPQTENNKTWGEDGNWFNKYVSVYILKTLLQFLKLDTQIEPGYSIFYGFSKIIPFISFVSFIVFVTIIYLLLSNKNVNKFLKSKKYLLKK